MGNATRRLVAGDNLELLSATPSRAVHLAYLDPPFNSRRAYGAYLSRNRERAAEAGHAFGDTWEWSAEVEATFQRLQVWLGAPAVDLVRSIVGAMGKTSMSAYVVMMAPRIVETHRVLADTGSIYVHCDPSASHILRLLLDQIFGAANFRNEIVWRRTHAHSSSRRFGPIHDSILFYTKSPTYTWNSPKSAYRAEYLEKFYRSEDSQGIYQLITCTAPGDRVGTLAHYEWAGQYPPPGRHWAWKRETMEGFERNGKLVYSSNGVPRLKRYAHEGGGVALQDVWLDINRLDAHDEERLGYETQKPLALLERIVLSSSNPGEVVLDPFGGTGTAAVAAEKYGRGWISVDKSLLASSLALARLRQGVNDRHIELAGFPASVLEARRLLRSDPLSFGTWAASMLATIIDRDAIDRTVAVGAGRLHVGRRHLDVLSWIPMRSRYSLSVPAQRQSRLEKLLLYVEDAAEPSRLRDFLQSRYPSRLHPIRTDDLVTPWALKAGLADRVVDYALAL